MGSFLKCILIINWDSELNHDLTSSKDDEDKVNEEPADILQKARKAICVFKNCTKKEEIDKELHKRQETNVKSCQLQKMLHMK